MHASLRTYIWGLITEQVDSDETSAAWSDERVSPFSLWLCDKLHQLLLLDLKMPLKGLMDFGDQSALGHILWTRGGSTSIMGLGCVCSDPDRL